MLCREILPLYENVADLVHRIRTAVEFALAPDAEMLELKNAGQLVPVRAADIGDVLFLGLAFPDREDMARVFPVEQFADVFVQVRTVEHFSLFEIFEM